MREYNNGIRRKIDGGERKKREKREKWMVKRESRERIERKIERES